MLPISPLKGKYYTPHTNWQTDITKTRLYYNDTHSHKLTSMYTVQVCRVHTHICEYVGTQLLVFLFWKQLKMCTYSIKKNIQYIRSRIFFISIKIRFPFERCIMLFCV